jgi:uncharacterized heparinase superfamily protein
MGSWVRPIEHADPWMGGNCWRHLNEQREIQSWNDERADKLWLYHLHYMEQPHAETAIRWIEENPTGSGYGWDPYPLSRRVANWIMWLQNGIDDARAVRRIQESLIVQAEWLRQSIEWHLLGNHILANAKALVLAGVYFDGPWAKRWLQEGLEILHTQLNEQILDDGGHFELSPMYHSLLLEDLLDLVNVSQAYPNLLTADASEGSSIASKMLGWLEQMTHPGGEIGYFNDSVSGMAPELFALQDYAARLSVQAERIPFAASGYFHLQAGSTQVLFDAGPVGPEYQPGHGHCDLLSLEISHVGRLMVANTGVSTYEPGVLRLKERRTAAHNTVRVDGEEQSQVWGSFRVAGRANVFARKSDGCRWAEASHDGYRKLNGGVVHRRRVEVEDGLVTVRDWLEGTGVHRAEIFWHPMPGGHVEIVMDEKIARREETSWRCTGFGKRIERPMIVGVWNGSLPAEFITRIRVC